MIPIYLANGNLYQHVPLERLMENAQHFEIVRNKRGHVRRAYMKQSLNFDSRPASMIGMAFQQSLPTGHVWALRGVTGSKA